MTLFGYSVVRCVPEPRTGEFINVGAIAGSEVAGDWEVRQISNMRRASRICTGEQLTSVLAFLAGVAASIEAAEEDGHSLGDDWLNDLYGDMRNVVQLSEPRPAVADSASSVLDLVFERMLIDPEKTARDFTSKHALLAALRRVYQAQQVSDWAVVEKPEAHVGAHLRAPLDFAFASDDRAVQISQAWSFQRGSVDGLATEVKSWGYALGRLRDGDQGRMLTRDGRVVPLPDDVAIEVLIAPPRTAPQIEVFEEAKEVFAGLNATTYEQADAGDIGRHALELVAV